MVQAHRVGTLRRDRALLGSMERGDSIGPKGGTTGRIARQSQTSLFGGVQPLITAAVGPGFFLPPLRDGMGFGAKAVVERPALSQSPWLNPPRSDRLPD
jgi:hypothetical protein